LRNMAPPAVAIIYCANPGTGMAAGCNS
jgi:hypothetical protein